MASKKRENLSPRATGEQGRKPATRSRPEPYMGHGDTRDDRGQASEDEMAEQIAKALQNIDLEAAADNHDGEDQDARPARRNHLGKTPESRQKQLANLRRGSSPRQKPASTANAANAAKLRDKIDESQRRAESAARNTRPPGIRSLLDPEPDEKRHGARLSKRGRIAWLEKIMGHPAVPLTTQMTAFNLHGKLTGDLLDDDRSGAAQAAIDPGTLMHALATYANLSPGRFLGDLGGASHVLGILCRLARVHPQVLASAALELVDDAGNVTLPELPLVQDVTPPDSGS